MRGECEMKLVVTNKLQKMEDTFRISTLRLLALIVVLSFIQGNCAFKEILGQSDSPEMANDVLSASSLILIADDSPDKRNHLFKSRFGLEKQKGLF